jgi:hypothetical protein
MFPLGSVVFPHTAVPVRVFEPRYRALLDMVMKGDRTFGVALIERGFEVGGGDSRFSIGTRVRVVDVSDLPEPGHLAVVIAGIARVRVRQWLRDDPHPWALVEDHPDQIEDVGDLVSQTLRRLTRVLLLASELGVDVAGIGLDLVDDPIAASYQLAALSPVGPLDAQLLLEAAGPRTRLEVASELLDARAELLTAQMGIS